MRRLEKPSQERKCIPWLRKHLPGREIAQLDRFLFLEKVSLSLVFGQKDYLALATLGFDQLDNCPSSLRLQQVKLSR